MKKVINIKTISDIFSAINEDNFEDFLKDFDMWIRIRLAAKKIGATAKDEDTFKWIDDNRHDVNIKIEIVADNN